SLNLRHESKKSVTIADFRQTSAHLARRTLRSQGLKECVMSNMRRKLLAVVALALAGASTSAHAADYYAPRAPYTVYQPLNGYSWAGPYIGANIGYAWGDITNSVANPSGAAGGVQGGYNWQFGQWLVGLEGDVQASGASDTFANWKFSNPWFGTLRG